mgnify:CR=1 FL=1
MEDEFFDESPSKIQRAVIAGASEALKHKAKEWKKSDDEILQDITDRVEGIINNID